MGDISKNFSRHEFACKCGCGFDTVDVELLPILQDIRDNFSKPVTITSGCRCESYNKKVGGADKSKHTLGRASDIKVSGVKAVEVYNYLTRRYPSSYGIILYSTWVHVDSREEKYRDIKG